MQRRRPVLVGVVAALAVGASPVGALGSPAKSPSPVAGEPSCNGLIIAVINHDSGPFGPSGNEHASAGPGAFLGPATHAAIEGFARGPNC
jgi:hypothetical protein